MTLGHCVMWPQRVMVTIKAKYHANECEVWSCPGSNPPCDVSEPEMMKFSEQWKAIPLANHSTKIIHPDYHQQWVNWWLHTLLKNFTQFLHISFVLAPNKKDGRFTYLIWRSILFPAILVSRFNESSQIFLSRETLSNMMVQ